MSHWISVNDKLPKYDTDVLVWGKDVKRYDKYACHVCSMDDLEDGMEYKKTGEFMWLTEKGHEISKVTHWMPLHEPPKQQP